MSKLMIMVDSESGTITISRQLYKELEGLTWHLVQGTDEAFYIVPIEDDGFTSQQFETNTNGNRVNNMPGVAFQLDVEFEAEGQPFIIELSELSPISTENEVKAYKLLRRSVKKPSAKEFKIKIFVN